MKYMLKFSLVVTLWLFISIKRNMGIKYKSKYHKSLFIITKGFCQVKAKLYQWEKRKKQKQLLADVLQNRCSYITLSKYCETFKNRFFYRTPLVAASEQTKISTHFSNKGKYIGPLTVWLSFREKLLGSCTF